MSTNLQFLRGLQADLNKITSAQDGAFYLTTDTNRLYVGQGTELVELNKSVITVNSFSNLPSSNIEEGQFYYVSDINVLCVYKGGKWVQINPDTKLNSVTTSISEANPAAGSAFDKKINVTHTFNQTTAAGNDNIENPTNTDSFETKNLKVEKVSENTIRFTGDTYEVNVPDKKNTVSDEGKITKYNKEAAITLKRNVAADGTSIEDTVKIVGSKGISSIVSDEETQTITITPTTIETMSNGCKDGTISIGIKETEGGGEFTTSFTPKFKYGQTEKEVKFDEDYTIDFDVYTIEEIDSITKDLEDSLKAGIRANNAMTYKGTVTSVSNDAPSLPADTKVSNGDLYMLALTEADTSSPNAVYKSGDFFIASGTEDDEGYITGEITWNYIPAGNDTYVTAYKDNAYQIVDGQNSNNVIGSVKIVGDSDIVVSSTSTDTPSGSGKNVVYTITHGTQEKTNHENPTSKQQDPATNALKAPTKTTNITTVDNLVVDDNGHVTAWDVQTVALIDTHNAIDSDKSLLTIAPGAGDKSADLTTGLTMTDGDAVTYTHKLKTESSNLEIAGNNSDKSVEFKLVWGTF